MNINEKELFDYLDNYIFDSQEELKGEINQWLCMKVKTKYYIEWKITDKLYNEYLDYKTK